MLLAHLSLSPDAYPSRGAAQDLAFEPSEEGGLPGEEPSPFGALLAALAPAVPTGPIAAAAPVSGAAATRPSQTSPHVAFPPQDAGAATAPTAAKASTADGAPVAGPLKSASAGAAALASAGPHAPTQVAAHPKKPGMAATLSAQPGPRMPTMQIAPGGTALLQDTAESGTSTSFMRPNAPSEPAPQQALADAPQSLAAPSAAGQETLSPAHAAPESPAATAVQEPRAAAPSLDQQARPPVDTGAQNWTERLADDVAGLRLGQGDEVRLSLAPERLGALQVRVSVENGVAQVVFLAEHPDAARLLQDAQPRLADALARFGLELGGHAADVFASSDEGSARDRAGDGEQAHQDAHGGAGDGRGGEDAPPHGAASAAVEDPLAPPPAIAAPYPRAYHTSIDRIA